MDKHRDNPRCKKLWAILKMDMGGTPTNRPEDREVDVDVTREMT